MGCESSSTKEEHKADDGSTVVIVSDEGAKDRKQSSSAQSGETVEITVPGGIDWGMNTSTATTTRQRDMNEGNGRRDKNTRDFSDMFEGDANGGEHEFYENSNSRELSQTGSRNSNSQSLHTSTKRTNGTPSTTNTNGTLMRLSKTSKNSFLGVTSDLVSPRSSPGKYKIHIDKSTILGRGGYGTVYLAKDLGDGTKLAVKEVAMSHGDGPEKVESALRALQSEFATLEKLEHEHIVRVYRFVYDPEKHVARVFMELMLGGSVRSWARKTFPGGRVPEHVARRIMFQALQGLEFLHSKGHIHRDFKPDNMLVSEPTSQQHADQVRVKLSDFGTARETINMTIGTETTVAGTVCYMSPEGVQGHFSRATDVWAWAASFVELLSGRPPWSEEEHLSKQTHSLIFHIGKSNKHPRIPPVTQKPLKELLIRCFAQDPKERPSPGHLLDHACFQAEKEQLVRDVLNQFDDVSPLNNEDGHHSSETAVQHPPSSHKANSQERQRSEHFDEHDEEGLRDQRVRKYYPPKDEEFNDADAFDDDQFESASDESDY